jgi:hypothetical protein
MPVQERELLLCGDLRKGLGYPVTQIADGFSTYLTLVCQVADGY